MRPRRPADVVGRPLSSTVRCPSMPNEPLPVGSTQQGLRVTRLVLRHSLVPYGTLGVVLIPVVVFCVVVSVRSGKWELFVAALVGCGIWSLIILMMLWYRVWLEDGVIHQRAFGMSRVSIGIDEITSVGRQVSNAAELARMNRPFRRICIEASTNVGKKFIDVSLKHFVRADIKELMNVINQARPDLVMPKGWI